jgi:hypothetical protein
MPSTSDQGKCLQADTISLTICSQMPQRLTPEDPLTTCPTPLHHVAQVHLPTQPHRQSLPATALALIVSVTTHKLQWAKTLSLICDLSLPKLMTTTNEKPTATHQHHHPRNRRRWMLWPNPIPLIPQGIHHHFCITTLTTTAETFVCATGTRHNPVGMASWSISTCTSTHCQKQTWRYTCAIILMYVTHLQTYQITLALQERITSRPKRGGKFSYNLHYPYSQSCQRKIKAATKKATKATTK